MKTKKIIFLFSLLFICLSIQAGQFYTLTSPDGKLSISIDANHDLQWSIQQDGASIMEPSKIAMFCESEGSSFSYGKGIHVIGTTKSSKSNCKMLTLKCAGDYNVEFRAYNHGATYRFVNIALREFVVKKELSEYRFADDYQTFVPYVNDNRGGERYCYSFESYYNQQKLSQLYKDSL